jgi:group I intron endonuclease
MYTIYKATNTQTGKSYVGFDSKWPSRKRRHKRISETNPKYHFHLAIQKYGWNTFEWEVLFQGWDLSFTKDFAEAYLINEHNTFGQDGYNMTRGGEGGTGYKHTPEARAKIKKAQSESNSMAGKNSWNKGKAMSAEARQKMSESHKGQPAWNKGVPMSDEQKQKLSVHYKGRPKSEAWKESMRRRIPWNKGKKKAP